MKTRFTQAIAGCAVVLGALAAGPLSAEAGTGLRYQQWATSGYTVSMSSYRYSNMTGFVQAIISSDPNVPCIAIDGNFGSVTTWYTAIAQNDLLGYNNGGVVDTAIWNGFQYAGSVYGPRLVSLGITDGYGTQHYGYYAGGSGSDGTRLGWNPISTQWLFSQTPYSNPSALVAATPNRTISSVPGCS